MGCAFGVFDDMFQIGLIELLEPVGICSYKRIKKVVDFVNR